MNYRFTIGLQLLLLQHTCKRNKHITWKYLSFVQNTLTYINNYSCYTGHQTLSENGMHVCIKVTLYFTQNFCMIYVTIVSELTHSLFVYLCRGLLVILGFKQLFATHCTYCFLVCTSLTIMRPHLMHFLPTDTTSLKFGSVGAESEFVSCNGFIFTNLATTTFNSISCS